MIKRNTNTHPLYDKMYDDWVLMQDVYEGERAVKLKGVLYLPPTAGMIQDGMANTQAEGWRLYDAYRTRAVMPNYLFESILNLMGLLHQKDADIQLPRALEPMRERATKRGETLQQVLRRINLNQLRYGRLGILTDIDVTRNMPHLAIYQALDIVNWDTREDDGKLRFVILDETDYKVNDQYQWVEDENYLICELTAQGYQVRRVGKDYAERIDGGPVRPTLIGNVFEEVPFTFINVIDQDVRPAPPPLIGLGRHVLAIYRGEADYRQALHLQAQETLVVTGAEADKSYRVGANASILLEDPQADAKYIGVSSDGLSEMRAALENDRDDATEQGARLLKTKGSQAEAGEALQTRVAAKAVTLYGLAINGAEGLERALKLAAIIAGGNPNEVSVTPNLDFVEDPLNGQEANQFMEAKIKGAPLSKRSLHAMFKARNLTKMDFEEEMEEIEGEDPIGVTQDQGDLNAG